MSAMKPHATDYRSARHSVFLLHAHLVFTPKYRKPIFCGDHLKVMEHIFQRVCESFDVELVEFNGEVDHVHLLINFPPSVEISKLVNELKSVSSRMLRKQFPSLARRYWKDVLWSRSYFAASCGGAPLEIIRQYVEQQRRPG